MWAILRNVLALILCGITIGLPLAKASARTIRSLLYSLAPFDPWTLSVVVITILAVAASASYIPARRASHVDPSDKVSTCIAGDGKTASTISTAKSIPTWKREPSDQLENELSVDEARYAAQRARQHHFGEEDTRGTSQPLSPLNTLHPSLHQSPACLETWTALWTVCPECQSRT
jgi:hypothetical protein